MFFKKKEPDVIVKTIEVEKEVVVEKPTTIIKEVEIEKPVIVEKEVIKHNGPVFAKSKSLIDDLRYKYMMCENIPKSVSVSKDVYKELFDIGLIKSISKIDNEIISTFCFYGDVTVTIKVKL